MLGLLFAFLPLVVAESLKAISYGEVRSAQTLFPSATSVQASGAQDTNYDPLLSEIEDPNDVSRLMLTDIFEHMNVNEYPDTAAPADFIDGNESEDDDPDGLGLDASDKFTEETSLVEHNKILGKRQRAPMYGGVMQIDCLHAPDICRNAGWYQNCLRGAHGNINAVTYWSGPYDETIARANRKNSGVTISKTTPCKGWPFAQRFYHPQTQGYDKPALETDEWPMATFQNSPFNPAAPVPQVSLRCMTDVQNKAGAVAWTNFRRCEGPYEGDITSSGYKKWKGLYAYGTRNGPCEPLLQNDWFHVNFNFSAFMPRGQNQTQDNIRDGLGYAEGPFPQSCSNDGLQFHLSNLRGAGRYARPYDTGKHNTYRLAYTSADIQQYRIMLTTFGNNLDETKVEVFRRFNDNNELLARQTQILAVGSSFVVRSAHLGLPLRIERTSCRYEFDYGNPQTDGIRWFGFHSENAGYESYPQPKSAKPAGQYCFISDIPKGKPEYPGKYLECSFPAW